jgi:hypothetical protein
MQLFSLRKIHRICPRHRGPGPPALAHRSIDFIKRWPLATGSIARIKPIESVSLLGCLDPIWHWVAIGSSQLMQESPGADSTAEAAGCGQVPRRRVLVVVRRGLAWRLTRVRVFSCYDGQFLIRFAPTGSQRRGERVYANLNRRRAAMKPDNSEVTWPVLVNGEGFKMKSTRISRWSIWGLRSFLFKAMRQVPLTILRPLLSYLFCRSRIAC